MLGQRLDREKGLIVSSAVAVRLQLTGVEKRPLVHEAQRTRREPAER